MYWTDSVEGAFFCFLTVQRNCYWTIAVCRFLFFFTYFIEFLKDAYLCRTDELLSWTSATVSTSNILWVMHFYCRLPDCLWPKSRPNGNDFSVFTADKYDSPFRNNSFSCIILHLSFTCWMNLYDKLQMSEKSFIKIINLSRMSAPNFQWAFKFHSLHFSFIQWTKIIETKQSSHFEIIIEWKKDYVSKDIVLDN